MRQCRVLYILLLLFFVTKGWLTNREPEVSTKWGLIRGNWTSSSRGRTIAYFLGIPYAEKPIGDLRFKSPQRWNSTWTETRLAVKYGEECFQTDLINGSYINHGSEDCLYLNVFVPKLADISEKLPILVFVHGGGFMGGNSYGYTPDYLLEQDIILVTLHYRLNIFGFFSTANQASPGNYGIKDIRMALEWVQENIHNFNGDAKSVTIMGHSAGAGAVHLLALSNKTEGLFNKYIILSGSALGPWNVHVPKLYRQTCLEVARSLGCLPNEKIVMNNVTNKSEKVEDNQRRNIYDDIFSMNDINNLEDDETMMKCMRNAKSEDILKTIPHLYVWRDAPMCVFGPVLEEDSAEAIVTMSPKKLIKNGYFRDIPAIMQVVKDEGLAKTLDFFTDNQTSEEFKENFEEYLIYLTEYHEIVANTSSFAAAIKEFYLQNVNETYDFARKITNMTGDSVVTWPMQQAARYTSEIGKSNLYFSYFEYEGTFSNTFRNNEQKHYGVCHGDDVNYLFPTLNKHFDWLNLHNTENDKTMINIMTEFWTNFVKNGVPKAWMVPNWPAYNQRNNYQFMKFGIGKSPNVTVQMDFMPDRMEFWEKLTENLSSESGMGRDTNIDRTTLINNIGTNEYKLLTHLTLLTVSFVTLSIYLL